MLLTLFIAFISLIVLMIIHEFGHFVIAKKFGVKVEEFGIGYPPRLFGRQFGQTLYSVNLIPLGAFVKIYGEEGGVDDYRSFSNLPIYKRVLICLGGVIAFWLASMVIFSAVFLLGASIPVGDQDVVGVSQTQVKITQVVAGAPAQTAGLQAGDILVRLSGPQGQLQINKVADFQKFVSEANGQPLTMTVERNGNATEITITPRTKIPAGQGALGVALERVAQIISKTAWYLAPYKGVVFTVQTTGQALAGLYYTVEQLVIGRGVPQGAALAGPVGITIFLSQAASYGAGFFLYFIGSLSVLLAIFNLLPIPALDGGKLLFLCIEKIKGSPISVTVEQSLTVVFFLLLITMSIVITIAFDVPRLLEFLRAGI